MEFCCWSCGTRSKSLKKSFEAAAGLKSKPRVTHNETNERRVPNPNAPTSVPTFYRYNLFSGVKLNKACS